MSETTPVIAEKNLKAWVIKDIIVPKHFYDRIIVDVPILNEIFGGQDMPGILPGTVFFFTGTPGAGKSTFMLQLADLLQKGKSVLYNVGEENEFMVKMRADRLNLGGNFALSKFEHIDDLIMYCIENGVDVLIQDSLQALKDGDLEGKKLLTSIIRKFQAFSKLDADHPVTIFSIGHVTKGGVFAGPNIIQHECDTHAHLNVSKITGNRVFELLKNRNGPATIPYEFAMSAAGIDFESAVESSGDEESPETEGTTSRAADRRAHVKDMIKEKLMLGDKISGYCFTRYGVDCSGGFWRGMLARAATELLAEGKIVLETKIDGRTHTYVEI